MPAWRRCGGARLGCINDRRALAVLRTSDKLKAVAERERNIDVVTACNDRLAAHGPYENHAVLLRDEDCRNGTTLPLEQLRTSALGAFALTEQRVFTRGAI
jgi:hypothetical protein